MDQASSLALARVGFGIGSFLAPRFSLKASGLDAEPTQAPFLLRLFASREVALGMVTLLSPPEHRASLIKAGLLVDSLDAVAGVAGLRSKQLGVAAGLLMTGAAAGAVAAGASALRREPIV